jgi:hypothetical protein
MRVGRKTLIVTIVLAALALAAVAVVPAIAAAGRGGSGQGLMMGRSVVDGSAVGGVCQGAGLGAEDLTGLLGMTAEEIVAERQAGKSLAQIAEGEGVKRADLIKAILDSRKAGLDQAVKDGRITQAQADQMIEQMTARVDAMVDETAVGGRGGMMGRGLGGGGGCCGGNETVAPTATATQI